MFNHEIKGINTHDERGGDTMSIEKALALTSEEYARLCEECNGFNDEKYINHPMQDHGESIADFLLLGSSRVKNNPVIRGNLI